MVSLSDFGINGRIDCAQRPRFAPFFDSPVTVRRLGGRDKVRLDQLGLRYQICIQEVAMAQVIVRNLDDEVVSSLKLKAKLKGHSLEQELRDILKQAAELTKEEKLALIDSIRKMTPRRLEDDSADLIREDRDSR